MPTPPAAGKVCVICGQDCSTKPRTKDGQGRYYCKPCHEQAVARKRMQQQAPTALAADEGPLALEGEGVSLSMMDRLAAVASPPVAMVNCPNCGFAEPAGSIVCAHCGFNHQTGRVMKPKVSKAPRVKQAAGGRVWPIIVGVVSILFGAGGVLVYGGSFVMQLLGGQLDIGSVGAGSLLTCLAMWLLRDGIGILRRNADSVKRIRLWAFVKILLYGLCLGVFLAIPNRGLEQMSDQLEVAGLPAIDPVNFKTAILLLLAWFLFWPGFIIVWFFIPRIQDDVEQW